MIVYVRPVPTAGAMQGHKKVKMPYPKYIELQKRLREREKERSEEVGIQSVCRVY